MSKVYKEATHTQQRLRTSSHTNRSSTQQGTLGIKEKPFQACQRDKKNEIKVRVDDSVGNGYFHVWLLEMENGSFGEGNLSVS